jgi:hypothetical protein
MRKSYCTGLESYKVQHTEWNYCIFNHFWEV